MKVELASHVLFQFFSTGGFLDTVLVNVDITSRVHSNNNNDNSSNNDSNGHFVHLAPEDSMHLQILQHTRI